MYIYIYIYIYIQWNETTAGQLFTSFFLDVATELLSRRCVLHEERTHTQMLCFSVACQVRSLVVVSSFVVSMFFPNLAAWALLLPPLFQCS